MTFTDHPDRTRTEEPLGSFELRLLRSLTELDQARPATVAVPAPRHHGRRQQTIVVTAVAATVLVGAAAAAGARLTLQSGSGEEVAAGGTVVMKGSGCAANSPLTLWLDRDVPLGTTTVRPDGLFIASATVPVTTAPGAHELRATCSGPNGADLTQTLPLDVTPAGQVEPMVADFDARGGVFPGSVAVFKGAGCVPDSAVTITVPGRPAVEINTTAGAAGEFIASGFVAPEVPVGSYPARAECTGADGTSLVQRSELTVVAPEPAEPAATKRAE